MPGKWTNESGLAQGKKTIYPKLDIGHASIRVDPGEEPPTPPGWTTQHGAPGSVGTARFTISLSAFASLMDMPEGCDFVDIGDVNYEKGTFEVTVEGPNLYGLVQPVFVDDDARAGFRFNGFRQIDA